MYHHRQTFKSGKYETTSCIIFQKHGLENVKIELIEEFPCENVEQLRKREGEIQRERECVNRVIAGRTRAEYYQDHAEQIRERTRQHYQEHAEELREYGRRYYQEHAEELREYGRQHYQEHAEERREQRRQHYQEHAEERREYQRQYLLRKKQSSLNDWD
jgi:hypothetical protein